MENTCTQTQTSKQTHTQKHITTNISIHISNNINGKKVHTNTCTYNTQTINMQTQTHRVILLMKLMDNGRTQTSKQTHRHRNIKAHKHNKPDY